MMKMNAGAWIGIVGGIIGLLVGIGAVLMTAGSMGIGIAIGMVVLFGGMFYLFYRLFFKPMINAARLQKTGLRGTATIKEVRDTVVTINNTLIFHQPLIRKQATRHILLPTLMS